MKNIVSKFGIKKNKTTFKMKPNFNYKTETNMICME